MVSVINTVNQIKNRVVVLGAAGFIGYHIAESISKITSQKTLIVDNFIRGKRDKEFQSLIASPSIEFIECDLSLDVSYQDLFHSNDIVINCAALNGTKNFYTNSTGVIRHSAISSILAAEYAAKANVSKYIFFGTPESYAGAINLGIANIPTTENVPLVIEDPLNLRWSYAASKTIGEIATVANYSQFGLNAKIFRIHNIFGPRMGTDHVVPDLVSKFLSGNYEVYGVEESRAFMYIDDLVFIVNKFISHDSIDNNLIYNIGSSIETQIKALAELILKQLNIDKSITPLPSLRGSVLRRVPDVTLLKKNIEFQETDLTTGVRKYIEWYIKAGGESNT